MDREKRGGRGADRARRGLRPEDPTALVVEVGAPGLPYVHWAHALTATDEEQMLRHAAVHEALVQLLLGDPRIEAVFHEWSSRDTVSEAVRAVHAADAEGSAEDVIIAFREVLRRATVHEGSPITDAFAAVLRDDLQLRWPSLAWALVESFCAALRGALTGRTMEIQTFARAFAPVVAVDAITLPAPARSSGAVVPLDDAVAALDQQIAALRAMREHFIAMTPKRAGIPRDRDRLDRYAKWIYQRACGVSVHQLAREYAAEMGRQDADDRKTVKYGIQEAERLLDLAGYRFAAPPGGETPAS